jgi:hypothetical protein
MKGTCQEAPTKRLIRVVRGSRFWLNVPLVALFTIDIALTLRGQPDEYWAGDYQAVIEKNPIAYSVLVRGPEVFVVLVTVWARRCFSSWDGGGTGRPTGSRRS